MLIRRQALKALVSGSRFLLREKTLAFAKLILPYLPYGKAVAVASILIEAFPTTAATKPFYCSAKPRWRRSFVFRLNPFCTLFKVIFTHRAISAKMTKKLLEVNQQGTLVDIGANFGYFSVLWLLNPRTNIVAIEPTSQNHELLTCNVSRLGIALKQCFAASESGQEK
jgi:hypothetical protein